MARERGERGQLTVSSGSVEAKDFGSSPKQEKPSNGREEDPCVDAERTPCWLGTANCARRSKQGAVQREPAPLDSELCSSGGGDAGDTDRRLRSPALDPMGKPATTGVGSRGLRNQRGGHGDRPAQL